MGVLMRAYDWALTPLGPVAGWPQSLRTAVDIVLRSPVALVLLWGPDGTMIYNDAYSVFAGGRHPRLLGAPVLEGWPEVADFNRRVMEVGLAGGTLSYQDQHLVLHRHGSPEDVWMDLDYSPVLDETGRPAGVLAVVIETTGHVRAVARLRESEARFRHMADSAPALIWMTDAEGRVTFANMHYDYMFGRPAGEMRDQGWRDIVLPEDLPRFTAAFFEAFENREPFRAEVRVRDRQGAVRWLRCEGVARLDDSHAFLGYTGINVDVTDVKTAEEHRDLLINELNHRVKNTLATVQSIATQTLRNAPSAEAAREAFEGRLIALSRAHDVLTRENWEGASLHEIVAQALEPYGDLREGRLRIEGPDVRLKPRIALALAMALQELATNAVKYGALSGAKGEVRIGWSLDRGRDPPVLRLSWEEAGGPPVAAPAVRGFGSRLIERSLAQDLGGTAAIDFRPAGVVCTVEAALG